MKPPIFVPLGTRCNAASLIKEQLKLRTMSLPFDWVQLPIAAIHRLVSIDPNPQVLEQIIGQYMDDIENHTQRHKVDGTWFVHDFEPNIDIAVLRHQMKEKYLRRFKRLYQILYDDQQPLVFVTVFAHVDEEANLVAYNRTCSYLENIKTNRQCSFISINLRDHNYHVDEINFKHYFHTNFHVPLGTQEAAWGQFDIDAAQLLTTSEWTKHLFEKR